MTAVFNLTAILLWALRAVNVVLLLVQIAKQQSVHSLWLFMGVPWTFAVQISGSLTIVNQVFHGFDWVPVFQSWFFRGDLDKPWLLGQHNVWLLTGWQEFTVGRKYDSLHRHVQTGCRVHTPQWVPWITRPDKLIIRKIVLSSIMRGVVPYVWKEWCFIKHRYRRPTVNFSVGLLSGGLW
jgi:hypothetical protein